MDDNLIKSLNDCPKPAVVSKIGVSELSISTNLSETDLRIIKCLLQSGARMEISEIAKELGISEKAITRRLDRIKKGRLLDFSLQCNPSAMIEYIQFSMPIVVAKSYYRNIIERMYSGFKKIFYTFPA